MATKDKLINLEDLKVLSDHVEGEVTDLKSDLESLKGGGLSNEAKTVLLRCFRNVAWINDQGQTYYDSLYAALFPRAEYQEVEYIESTGTQRILLENVITNLKTDGWSVDTVFQLTNSSATGSSGVLCQHEASCQWFGCWNTNVNYGNSTSALNKISVHTEWTETGIDNTINGTTSHGNYASSGTNFTLPNFCIFAMPMNGGTYDKYAKMKLYSMKLYKNNVLFADLVPCYRKADGVIGLYDAKRSVFLVNSGTGSFLKGGDV